MKFYDQHSHTVFSPDARTTVLEVAEHILKCRNKKVSENSAEGVLLKSDAGLVAGIAFTDHLDLEPPIHPLRFKFDISDQQAEIQRVQKIINEQGDKLSLFRGVEVGLQPHSIKLSKEYIEPYRFDVVIASLHFIDGLDPYRGTYFEDKDYKQAFSHAYEVMYKTVTAFEEFDILGHFDYVARYSPYTVQDIFYKDFPDELDALLKYLAENGKALEINTKTYALHPNRHIQILDTNILARFKEFGGELITLGSDAHTAQRIGEHFEYYWEVVKSVGFTHLAYFENRKPIFYNPESI